MDRNWVRNYDSAPDRNSHGCENGRNRPVKFLKLLRARMILITIWFRTALLGFVRQFVNQVDVLGITAKESGTAMIFDGKWLQRSFVGCLILGTILLGGCTPRYPDSDPNPYTLDEKTTRSDRQDDWGELRSGTTLPSNTTLPRGTTLPRSTTLPRQTTLPGRGWRRNNTTLPRGNTTLPNQR